MDGNDDVDEDELALAMSTELTQPVRSAPIRRARSFTSFGTAAALGDQSVSIGGSPQRRSRSPRHQAHNTHTPPFAATLIKIKDNSAELANKEDSDGLWASNVTVTDPSIVRGTDGQGIAGATGYVGSSPVFPLYSNSCSLALHSRNF